MLPKATWLPSGAAAADKKRPALLAKQPTVRRGFSASSSRMKTLAKLSFSPAAAIVLFVSESHATPSSMQDCALAGGSGIASFALQLNEALASTSIEEGLLSSLKS